MQARMKNPVFIVPGALQAVLALGEVAKKSGVPARTLDLVYLRASQINGCSVCVDMHARDLRKNGETDERAALALTEATTRVSDRADPVPDDVWEEAKRHYDEAALAALVLNIALIN